MAGPNRRSRPYIAAEATAAATAFRDMYGPDLRFAPILVVIAAYDEEDSLGEVLDAVPEMVAGLSVDTLVVDDGSTDATVRVAEGHQHVRVALLRRNCGHGVALRLGYRLPAGDGAREIRTVAAGMQGGPPGRAQGVPPPPP